MTACVHYPCHIIENKKYIRHRYDHFCASVINLLNESLFDVKFANRSLEKIDLLIDKETIYTNGLTAGDIDTDMAFSAQIPCVLQMNQHCTSKIACLFANIDVKQVTIK